MIQQSGRVTDKPPPARNPAGGAIKRRSTAAKGDGQGSAASRNGGQPGILKFYDQEAPGIKMCVFRC